MDIRFSAPTIAGYAVSGVIMMLIPIAVLIIWHKRTHAKLKPTLVGAIIFPVFALALKVLPAYPLYFGNSAISQKINAAPWLYYLIAGLLAGLFEETGRFIAFRYLLKKDTSRRTAISYGIGHGGIEALYFGWTTLSLIILALLINSGRTDELTKDIPAEMLPQTMEKLKGYAEITFGKSMLSICERISAMMMQTGLSILVFKAVHDKKSVWLYPLAMLIHAAIDFTCIFYDSCPIVFEAGFMLSAAAALLIAIRLVYNKMPEEKEAIQ